MQSEGNLPRIPEKRSWLFLRGLARSQEHWGPFTDVFKSRFPKDEIEFLDTAGNGTERHRRSFLSIAEYVEDLRLRSRLARNQRNLNLVCVSMGGMIGSQWAASHEQDLASLTLINSSDAETAHVYERLRPQNYLSMVQNIFLEKDRLRREKAILEMTCQTLENADFWAERFSQTGETSRTNVLRQLLASARFAFPEQKPPCDVVVLVGMRDQFVDPVCSHRLAARWGVQCIEHPSGPHDLPLADPNWVCDQLVRRTP